MKNDYHNPSDERNIKHLKETIDLLRKENNRLRSENKLIPSLKDTIKKLQEEKIEISQKIIDYESESLLYNANKENKDDILLYNPKIQSKKIFELSLIKENFSFSFYGKKNTKYLKDGLMNKNEEITILKNELVKKEEIISLLNAKNKKIELKKEKCNNFSLNVAGINTKGNSNRSSSNGKAKVLNSGNLLGSNNNTNNTRVNDINKYTSAFSWMASPASSNNNKKRNVVFNHDMMYEETESHLSLEKNIYKEIQNILEEKRNFILNTLTYENFSFDIIRPQKNKNTGNNNNNNYINGLEDIDKLIEIVKNRKLKVQKNKKYFEEKLA